VEKCRKENTMRRLEQGLGREGKKKRKPKESSERRRLIFIESEYAIFKNPLTLIWEEGHWN